MRLKKEWKKLSSEKRLHGLDVPVIGLTGGIATGKSTVAKLLEKEGLPVINADHLVKEIYRDNETLDFLRKNYADAITGDAVDFRKLREKVFSSAEVKNEIETFIYARLPRAFQIAFEKLGKPSPLVYDVPLLFEKKLDALVDVKVLVYAPENVQRARLMERDAHEEAMATRIMESQMDIEEKRMKSDFVIDNSGSMVELAEEVKQFLRQIFE